MVLFEPAGTVLLVEENEKPKGPSLLVQKGPSPSVEGGDLNASK